jgi:hypothetical protein
MEPIPMQSSSPQPQTLTPSSAYKNSKTRRSEYSVKGLRGSNSQSLHSQDSAFSSMTEQNSFQSFSSPIDEITEVDLLNLDGNDLKLSPSSDIHLRDLDIPGPSNLYFLSPNQRPIKETCIYLEPPKLKINNENYTPSSTPHKKCSESFSQKYR